MKRSIIFALAATLVLSVSSSAFAQGGVRMALIDVGYIFKNHKGFQTMRENLEQEVNLANIDFQNTRQRLEGKQQELQELKKSHTAYAAKEAELAREAADMNAALALKRNQFSDREAAIYYQVYQEVRDATAAYCKQNGIHVAMQFNGNDQLATDNPNMVQSEVARRVVYYDKALDITPAVLGMLNSRAGTSANAGVGPNRRQQ